MPNGFNTTTRAIDYILAMHSARASKLNAYLLLATRFVVSSAIGRFLTAHDTLQIPVYLEQIKSLYFVTQTVPHRAHFVNVPLKV